MSKRNKLLKFAEIQSFPNVYENPNTTDPKLLGLNGEEVNLKGKWSKEHFRNDAPLTLELACGGGEYTVEMARRFPDRNFIGVDVKGARIWKGSKIALAEEINNAAFLRTRIEQIALFYEEEEVDEIWITFPDPFLKEGKANRRLTSPYFIKEYRKVLKKGGILHLKTDDPTLYNYTLETLNKEDGCSIIYQDDDIYTKPLPIPELDIKTYYEEKHLAIGRTIKYVRFLIS